MENSSKTSRVKFQLPSWGRYPSVTTHCQRPEKWSSVKQIIQKNSSILPRGQGRSYGDACLTSETTVLMERLNRMLDFDAANGILRCEAGVTLREILEVFVPRGWFLSVTPGTKFVTVGGAIAFDVHGKNHHRDGSFGNFVSGFNLMVASGEIVHCSRQEHSDLFWATVGGMGLTGIITEAELKLKPIQTAYIKSLNIKANNLEEAIALFEEYEPNYQYSVAWIDCLATGKSLGRSILMLGNHAHPNELSHQQQISPLNITPKKRFKISFDAPQILMNRYTVGMFNSVYFSKQQQKQIEFVSDYDSFFYTLDSLQDWNRLYGKPGFVQYQFVVPLATSHQALTTVLQLSSQKGWGSFLAVLKRMGKQEGWLSFPMPGYTLALDLPIKPGLWEFLHQLDQIVLNYGGRVYLAKDARLKADTFRAMYSTFSQWLSVKSQIDPDNHFTSSLSQRLQIASLKR